MDNQQTKHYALASEWRDTNPDGVDGPDDEPTAATDAERGLAAVLASVGTVAKDGENPEFRYAYRSADALLGAIQPLLAAQNIFMLPRVLDFAFESYETRSGGTMKLCRVLVSYRFVSGTDGSAVEMIAAGEGADTQDKGLNKAMTSALKNLLGQAFCVPTGGEDSEASDHSGEDAQPAAAPRQQPLKAAPPKAAPPKAAAPQPTPPPAAAAMSNSDGSLPVPDGGWPEWISEQVPMGKYKGSQWADMLGHEFEGDHHSYSSWAGSELDPTKGTAAERFQWVSSYYDWLAQAEETFN